MACLGAALCYSLAGIYGRRFACLPPVVTAAGQVTGSAALMLPLALLVDRPWSLPVPLVASLAAVGGLAVLCTALAFVLYFRILKTAGATNVLLVTFLVPVSALVLGAAVLGEPIEVRHLLGFALLGVGLTAIDGRPLGWIRAAAGRRRRAAPQGSPRA